MAPRRHLASDQQAIALVENAGRRAAQAAEAVALAAPLIVELGHVVAGALRSGGKIIVFGNGGSAACAQHFAAEFTGKLSVDRVPYSALALTVDTSALTAIANDYGYLQIFARQVIAHTRPGDVVLGLSTSGTSANVREGIAAARALGAITIALTGYRDELGAEHSLRIPLVETARIQEGHDIMLHELAQVIERFLTPMSDDASADRFTFVLDESDLGPFREWIGETGQRLVTTNGVFDVLHEGHHASLRQARLHGDRLVVLLNSDDSVRALKGPARPIRGQGDRVRDLQRSTQVDHVVVMNDLEPSRLLRHLAPQVHAKGADYAGRGVVEEATVVAGGGRVEYLEVLSGYSTSAMEAQVRSSGS